jgi:hypothetical protein
MTAFGCDLNWSQNWAVPRCALIVHERRAASVASMVDAKSLRRLLFSATTLLMMGGCDYVAGPAIDASRCEAPDYQVALAGGIDEMQVWAGNQDGFAPTPLLVSQDPDRIAATAAFFLDRSDQWYIAAGETYDPASRRSGSEFTIKFLREGKERAYIGWGHSYLETAGCGFEVVRPLSPPDRPELFHLVFDAPQRP